MSQSDPPAHVTPQETTSRTVVGLFSQHAAAEAAIRDLREAGFADDRIGVAMQERVKQGDLLEELGGEPVEGAAKGAVSGGLVGGLLGLLGSLLIPGLGPVLAGGCPRLHARGCRHRCRHRRLHRRAHRARRP